MSELNEMTCAELADVAAELALGVLTGRERAVAIAHLDTCDACREDVRQLMATGDQLLELLPSVEPSAGFETRVLHRLGLPAPASQDGHDNQDNRDGQEGLHERHERVGQDARRAPDRTPDRTQGPRHRRTGRDAARPSAGRSAPPAGPGAAGRPGRPGQPGRPGRMRRMLAAAAVGLAVIAAGLGGWRIGVGLAPASQMTAASLVSTTNSSQNVGKVYYYTGDTRWLYMQVAMGSGNATVTCQVIGADGRVSTIGSFRLADGYGSWGSPDPGDLGKLTGARLLSSDGTVLATGTFIPT